MRYWRGENSMPKVSNHKKDEVYQSIMGNPQIEIEQEMEKLESIPAISKNPEIEVISSQDTMLNSVAEQKKQIKSELDELVHKSYYITKRQVKALKMRVATSDSPEEKDFSAIVRSALDAYLADTLKYL
jgi:hypothetical protein